MNQAGEDAKSFTQRILDIVEAVGNKVPHPVIIFLILIAIVLVLSHVLFLSGASVTYQVIDPHTHEVETTTTTGRSLLTASGIRDMVARLVPSFMGFTAIGLLVVAMVGVGVAEEAGLTNAIIRKLVAVSPAWSLTYILAFVGIMSSIASDAGYVVLILLAAAAFLGVGRHPHRCRAVASLRGLDDRALDADVRGLVSVGAAVGNVASAVARGMHFSL